MFGSEGGSEVGQVRVTSTNNTGLSVEHWAERALDRIVYVSGDHDSPIRQQAEEFKENVRATLIYYIQQAIKSDRTTLYNLFIKQGHKDMAEILRRL